MSKEKANSLTKYLNELKNKLTSDTPAKHKHREKSYRNFLNNEIKNTTAALEAIKLENPTK